MGLSMQKMLGHLVINQRWEDCIHWLNGESPRDESDKALKLELMNSMMAVIRSSRAKQKDFKPLPLDTVSLAIAAKVLGNGRATQQDLDLIADADFRTLDAKDYERACIATHVLWATASEDRATLATFVYRLRMEE
jgi:hypothetical protein